MIESKLPKVKTTIFATMSALAQQHRAINLGQGFPDFHCDPKLIEEVNRAMLANCNQYPPMPGIEPLRSAIAKKTYTLYGANYDVDHEITITAGATQAIMTSILTVVRPGDEVIVIEPAYDSYIPSIELAGGIPVLFSMSLHEGQFSIDWDLLSKQINKKTRLIIVNSPHNPTGVTLEKSDYEQLANLLRGTNILLISDEVYEHMVFDGKAHYSVASHPELAQRSFIISSFGKTYHVTGWKVGYVLAPKALTKEFRKIHQFNVFTVNTPMQYGLAAYMNDERKYTELSDFYQEKRDFFRNGLSESRFKLLPVQGTYFQCVDYSAISNESELEFASWLTSDIGVAAIPVSAFYQEQKQNHLIRFCFAKQKTTLERALERLIKI
ncbi:pyridoxal phosphate-dependent aminotransferase [Undibacterium fentianense]|uniref:Pyridoxal phosphate-dependent aminotransferase n=1 Tax=Undibacterium fentianense TaxID=2828728 RepID=A0A941E087_9BURK|nr:pyridoxal phosphate-dependent aminotransferase [Undibacterium fentianense]MBR7798627.1 pyridoxal phosphate-dependent aminotransferase [Undibacterium fentianense]